MKVDAESKQYRKGKKDQMERQNKTEVNIGRLTVTKDGKKDKKVRESEGERKRRSGRDRKGEQGCDKEGEPKKSAE